MSNVGHTYNNLGYNFTYNDYPQMGALGKHFNYFEKDDIGYYEFQLHLLNYLLNLLLNKDKFRCINFN